MSDDSGGHWRPLNKGCAMDFMPDELKDQPYGHDPHCVRLSSNPDRLYQQNHCGIYRLDRPATRWVRIGESMRRLSTACCRFVDEVRASIFAMSW